MPTPLLELDLPDPEATAGLARALAPCLAPGDVLLLSGPLGAGKSVFARALIQSRLAAAGRMEEVPSPTYTLVQTYDDGTAELWHADLYRLGDPGEVVELGLDEAFRTAICLVEWPERLGGSAPAGAVTLALSHAGESGRRLVATGPAAWAPRLEGIVRNV